MLPPVLLAAFPGLASADAEVTHPPDGRYNCVAWAAGVTDAWWWPGDPAGYWPPGVPDEPTVAAVSAALGAAGYVPCAGGEPGPGYEKAAVYAVGGSATHVAVGRAGGGWSSKLGRDGVARHATPAALEGAVYGRAVAYLQRPVPAGRT